MRPRYQNSHASSILTHQKPNRKKKRRRIKKFIIYSFAAVSIGGVAILGVRSLHQFLHAKFMDQKTAWQVSIHIEPEFKQPQLRSAVESHVRELMAKTASNSSDLLAEQLKKNLPLESLRVTQTSTNDLYLQVKLYVPFLRLQWDRIRYVTKAGEVLGDNDKMLETLFPTEALPLVTGIFTNERDSRTIDPKDLTLVLEKADKQTVKSAVDLVSTLQAKKIPVNFIRYIKHRGFMLTQKSDGAEILIGNPPYATKVEQLQKVLRDLQKRQVQASRIELDYEGKAFIKEKGTL